MRSAHLERLLKAGVLLGVLSTWWSANVAYYEHGVSTPSRDRVEFRLRGRQPMYVPVWVPGVFYGSWIAMAGAIGGIIVLRTRRSSRAREGAQSSQTADGTDTSPDFPSAIAESASHRVNERTLVALATRPRTRWVISAYAITLCIGAIIFFALDGRQRVEPLILLGAAWAYALLISYLLPLALLIEREALVIVRQRWLPPGIRTNVIPLSQILKVVRARDSYDENTLLVETTKRGRYPIHFALSTHSPHTHLALIVNRSAVKFPPPPMAHSSVVAAFCDALQHQGVVIEFIPQRWYRKLWRRLNPPR